MSPLSIARAAGKIEPATEYMTMFQHPSKIPKQTRQKAAPTKLAEVVTQAVMQPRPTMPKTNMRLRPKRSAR